MHKGFPSNGADNLNFTNHMSSTILRLYDPEPQIEIQYTL